MRDKTDEEILADINRITVEFKESVYAMPSFSLTSY